MQNTIRLKDLVLLIPADIEIGIIKRKNGDMESYDISELNAQYCMDSVEAFDIRPNYFGERALIVWLVHNK